ncbi:hypothetical protein [Acinetobacter indicus]|uniref:hypothetical protein n=1 Tax=Acinetobacter indicus TaxID=756892 RepID=UPI00144499D2|nr:hypothetical protein [Acinetobacter indicus]
MAAASQSVKQRVQNSIWLVCGALCLLLAIIFWAITDRDELVEVEKAPESEVELQIQPAKVAATAHLGVLIDEVKPLEQTKRLTASGLHEPEFRGTKFISEQRKHQTIELFRVSEEDIIKGFLKKQADRQNFLYIRLSGENRAEQYVLLYGNYKNTSQAQSALEQLALQLPASVKPVVTSFKDYLPFVNDLGAEEVSLNNKLYEVALKPAALPKIDESLLAAPKQSATSPQRSTTTTTVTRRDQDGNVVDVQKSQSGVAPPVPASNNTTTEQEISDPFN